MRKKTKTEIETTAHPTFDEEDINSVVTSVKQPKVLDASPINDDIPAHNIPVHTYSVYVAVNFWFQLIL